MKQPSSIGIAPNLVRVDKNVAYNITDFSLINDESGLIKSLIYYFCHSYQNNFFGYGVLDPMHFAKTFNYTTNYLQATVKKPAQFKGKSEKEISFLIQAEKEDPSQRVFDSRLENALYILSTQPVSFSNEGQIRDFNEDIGYFYRKISSMLFIEQLEVRFTRPKSGRGKEKILYNYQLNKEFVKNLSTFYLKANTNSFIKLRKANFDDLYIHLVTARTNLSVKNEHIYRPKFDHLWSVLGKHREEKREQKRELKKALEKIQKETELNFELTWEKSPNSRFAYQPVINFEKIFSTPKEREDAIKNERRQVFDQNLIHEMLEVLKSVKPSKYYSENRENNFLNWMRDNKIDIREKSAAYEQAQLKTYLKIPKHIDAYKRSFFNNIKPTSTLKEIFTDVEINHNAPKQEYIID